MKRYSEDMIQFTTVKKGASTVTQISVGAWEGELTGESVEHFWDFPCRRRYVVCHAQRPMGSETLYDGFTLQEVKPGFFEFELESERRAAEEAERAAAREAEEKRIRQEGYDSGVKEGEDWMSAQVEYVLGHNLDELAEHLPEIRRIFGDPEPDPLRRGQGRGERR